jgi:hypothetical protein
MDKKGLLPGSLMRQTVRLTTHVYLVARLRMNGATPPLLIILHGVCRENFTFILNFKLLKFKPQLKELPVIWQSDDPGTYLLDRRYKRFCSTDYCERLQLRRVIVDFTTLYVLLKLSAPLLFSSRSCLA